MRTIVAQARQINTVTEAVWLMNARPDLFRGRR
jgi:hypothetical protein